MRSSVFLGIFLITILLSASIVFLPSAPSVPFPYPWRRIRNATLLSDEKSLTSQASSVRIHIGNDHDDIAYPTFEPEEEFDRTPLIPSVRDSSFVFRSHSINWENNTLFQRFPPNKFPIAVIAHKRHELLRLCLQSLLAVVGSEPSQITVFQDADDSQLEAVATSFPGVSLVQNKHGELNLDPGDAGAYHIAHHYGFALRGIFDRYPAAPYAIIVEEDMVFSPDFLLYFSQTAHLYERDPTIYCITSWNDNGHSALVRDPTRLYRTDFFVGLGWLVNRQIYEQEWKANWPIRHWDHWLREEQQRKGRQCVYPEVSRNYNIGKFGTHSDEVLFERYFSHVAINPDPTVLLETSHMTSDAYAKWLESEIRRAIPVDRVSQLYPQTSDKESDPSPTSTSTTNTTASTTASTATPAIPTTSAIVAAAAVADVPKQTKKNVEQTPKEEATITESEAEADTEEKQVVYVDLESWGDHRWENLLAPRFSLWHSVPHIRNMYQGVIAFRWKGRLLYLVAIFSPYARLRVEAQTSSDTASSDTSTAREAKLWQIGELVSAMNEQSSKEEMVLRANQRESCTAACRRKEMECSASALQRVNDCSFMKTMSELGCQQCYGSEGVDQPAIVVDPKAPDIGHCLVNSRIPTCGGEHPVTARVCVCAPAADIRRELE